MAYTTIDNPELFFQTKLYTGNATDDTAITLDGDENMQPDWVWIKDRTNGNHHRLYDSVRGATKVIYSSLTSAEGTASDGLKSFDSDGFTLGDGSDENGNSANFASWNWKAGTSFSNDASATGVGDIDSTGSVNTDAGFSIVSYTGNGTSGTEVAHGLGSTPDLYITKSRSYAYGWGVYHKDIANDKGFFLHANDAELTGTGFRDSTAPTSSVFTLGGGSQPYRYTSNKSGETYIGYFFNEVKGYSKFGSYTGNGSTDGTFVYTGFKPAWVISKRTDGSNSWRIFDTKRPGFNTASMNFVHANLNNAEDTGDVMDLNSNGFKIRTNSTDQNTSGSPYIYMAFAESPFTNSNGIPNNAR